MNYEIIYAKLIERGRLRQLDKTRDLLKEELGYIDRHHIVPKCINGDDHKDNLVYLTAEEHFVAHQLLVKIYPDNEKLLSAAIKMSGGQKGRPKYNNKLYGWLKRRWSESRKEFCHTAESKEKISNKLKGRIFSDEWREKLGNARRGRKHTPESIQKMSEAKLGHKHTTETKEKISKIVKGKNVGNKNPFFGKTHTPEIMEQIKETKRLKIEKLGEEYGPSLII